MRDLPVAELFMRAVAGNRRALGRLLTITEQPGPAADEITDLSHTASNGAQIIGITGAPGSGKSTLVGALVQHIAGLGHLPAVLAIDPSSPLTGGAILGDRVRMADVEQAFIRSMATRGHSGGLALSVPGAVRLFDAVGYSPIIIETVGVGQVEVDVTAAADTTVVVVTPGMGDAVQANKAGLLEVADVFVVNKADQPGADDSRRDLELMLDLSHMTGQEDVNYRPPILMTNSLIGEGASEVFDAIAAHYRYLGESNTLVERRRRRARFELENRVRIQFERNLALELTSSAVVKMLDDVVRATATPADAARVAGNAVLRPRSD